MCLRRTRVHPGEHVATRTKKAQAERAAWWARRPWPIGILGIDPGSKVSGAALVVPDEAFEKPWLAFVRDVDPMTRELEHVLREAVSVCRGRGLELHLVLEEWGAGGPLGIDSWLGLGAARGHWMRAAHLMGARGGDGEGVLCPASRLCSYALTQRWRSWMDVPVVTYDVDTGENRRNEPDDWKRHATRRVSELAPHVQLSTADGAEAALIGLYGSRCDDVGKKLPMRLLERHGLTRPG